MALKECKECGKEVSTKADKCPHCGVNNPTTSTFHSILAVVSFFIVLGLFCSFFGDDSNDEQSSEPVAETTQKAESNKSAKEEKQLQEQKKIIQSTINKFRESNFLKKVDGPGRTYYVNSIMWRAVNAEQKENSVIWLARHAGYFFSNVNEAVGITVKDWQSGKTIAEYSFWSGVEIK